MNRLAIAALCILPALSALGAPLHVTDRAGRPVEGAEVRAVGSLATDSPSRSDAAGLVEAPEGLLQVTATGFLPFEGPGDGTIVLTRPSRVAIRAIDQDTGTAVGAGRLRIWFREAGEGGSELLEAPPDEPALQEVTLAEGRALLDGLESGTYRVHVEVDGYLAVGRSVAPGPEAQDEVTLALRPASVVEGRVLRGGKPVEDARLRVLPGLPGGFPGGGPGGRGGRAGRGGGPGGEMRAALGAISEHEVRTDALGRFRFDQLPAERRVSFLLVAQAPDFTWGVVEIPATARGAAPATAAERNLSLDVPVGPGTVVTGRAIWSDGAAAVGVSVGAELVREMRGFGGARRFGVSLSPVFQDWGGGPEDVTGPDGDFTIRGLPEGSWQVVATPVEHAPSEPVQLELVAGAAPPEPLTLEIVRGLTVEGLIVDPAGNPVADAEIVGEINREGSPWPEQRLDTTSDGKGRFSISGLERGDLTLRVNAAGYGNKRVDVGPVGDAGSQRIELTRTGRLFGIALNGASGEPLTRFRVAAVRAGEQPESGGFARFRGRATGPEIVSEDGSFELDEIEEGRWAVIVRADGYLTRVSEPAEVRTGEAADVGRVELAPGAVVLGRVEDGDDSTPLAGATVTVQGIDSGGAGRFGFQRRGWGSTGEAPSDTTDQDGSFRLDGLPPGEFTVSAGHHAYPMRAEHSQRISVGEDPSSQVPALVIKMERGGTVSGRVLDSSGEAVAGAVVVAVEPDARRRGSVVGGPTDADDAGAFVIEALPAGEVLVRRADRMDGGVKVLVRKGEVAEVLLQDQGVRVHGGLFVAGRPVEGRVRVLAGTWGAPRTDWGKTYELAGVPPGDWTLRVDLRDDTDPTAPVREERVKLTVPEGQRELQHDIRLEAEDTSDDTPVEGRVVDVDTGEGLEGWLITARQAGGQRETTRSDATGTFRLTLTEPGEWALQAMATSTDPPYDAPAPQQLLAENGRLQGEPPHFEAKRRLEVSVRVVDLSGAPVAGATCALINKAEHLTPQAGLSRIGPAGAPTDALGRAIVSASEPGFQDLLVVLASRAFLIRTGVRVGGGAEVEVQLPHTGTLEIRGARDADLLGLPGGWWMKLSAGQNRYGLLETRGDTLLMHGLPGGDYQVRVDGELRDAEVVPGPVATVLDFTD